MKNVLDHAKIRQLQLYTRKLLSQRYAGNVRSGQRGYGLDFDQLREYAMGDDIRAIDWKSSARTQRMMIKEYYHEHRQKIILMCDVSASTFYGSTAQTKHQILASVATVLLYAAEYSNAHIGMLLFSDQIEWYQKAGGGSAHLTVLLEKVWGYQPRAQKTSLAKACAFIGAHEQEALIIMLTDGIDHNYLNALQYVSKRHEVVIVRCLDRHERNLPAVGVLYCQDPETQTTLLLNTHKKMYTDTVQQRLIAQDMLLKKNNIDCFDITAHLHSLDALILFFARRLVR